MRGPAVLGVIIAGALAVTLALVGPWGQRDTGRAYSQARCEAIDYTDPDQGRRTFTEDFDGTEPDGTGLDPARWRIRDDTYLDFDQAQIRRENVTVHDGLLDIAGHRLPLAQWQITPDSRYLWNRVRDYSTGYVDTIKTGGYGNEPSDRRFSQRHGSFEVRAKVPSRSTMSRGIWPAFWLRADHELGEIDPMEAYGAPTIREFDPSAAYEWNSWADTSQKSTVEHTQGRAQLGRDAEPVWKDFHVYGVTWSPTCLRYTFDGRTVGTVPLSAKPYFTGPTFEDTFHLRLNMQIGSNYWGRADDAHTRTEFHYLVDWVRVSAARD